jgi:hypothetical protein
MIEVKHGKEVVLTTENKAGLLFDISKLLAEKGISILGFIGAASRGECLIRLVTDDTLRTIDALTDKGYEAREETAILLEVPHKPGMLKRVTEVLASEKIDIRYVYATALDQHERCLLVLHTDNDDHALPKLNKMATSSIS